MGFKIYAQNLTQRVTFKNKMICQSKKYQIKYVFVVFNQNSRSSMLFTLKIIKKNFITLF